MPLRQHWLILLIFVTIGAAAALALAATRNLIPLPSRRAKPFGQAARQITPTTPPLTAMLTLHRAFDSTAGHSLLATDLADFLHRHAKFRPLQTDIEHFFAASAAIFFGTTETLPGGTEARQPPPLATLRSLAHRLRRAERTP